MTDWERFKSILMLASALRKSIVEFNKTSDKVQIESGMALLVKGLDEVANHFGHDSTEIETIANTVKVLTLYDISLLEGVDGETV